MNKNNWLLELEKLPDTKYISGEIYLTENASFVLANYYPHKTEATIACVCIKGEMEGTIDLLPVHAGSPGLLILLPGQILLNDKLSSDFQGIFIVMTQQFIEKIDIPEAFPVFMSIRTVPFVPLDKNILNGILDYCRMLRNVLHNTVKEFNRKAIIRHLTIAFFYGLGYYLHEMDEKDKKSREEIIIENFLKLLRKNFREERSIEFYADKLCFTPKYLSTVIKKGSGKTARQWIDGYIILEAKYLLKSTDITILQITDQLNFPSQSFFGKYFKRIVGISPTQYRRDQSTK